MDPLPDWALPIVSGIVGIGFVSTTSAPATLVTLGSNLRLRAAGGCARRAK